MRRDYNFLKSARRSVSKRLLANEGRVDDVRLSRSRSLASAPLPQGGLLTCGCADATRTHLPFEK